MKVKQIEDYGEQVLMIIGENDSKGNIGKYYRNNSDNNPVCAFDVDEETQRHEPWTGSDADFKENLDKFLQGGFFAYPSGGVDSEGRTGYDYNEYISGGFIKRYSGNKFKETLGEYTYSVAAEDEEGQTGQANDGNALLQNRKKRVTVYQLQSNT